MSLVGKKILLFKAMAILLGFAFVLGLGELILRLFPVAAPTNFDTTVSLDFSVQESPEDSDFDKLNSPLPIPTPQEGAEGHNYQKWNREYNQDAALPKYMKPGLGERLFEANRDFESSAMRSGRYVYKVHVSTDTEGRRKTIDFGPEKKKGFLLALGCSFVYGFGLEDRETLPSQLSRYVDERVYNYGRSGFGPFNTWLSLNYLNLSKQVPEMNGIAFYYFLPIHMDRIFGKIRPLSRLFGSPWVKWEKNSKEQIQLRATIGPGHFYNDVHTWLYSKQLVRFLNLFFPEVYSEEDLKILARIMVEMKDQLKKSKKLKEFYFVLAPTKNKEFSLAVRQVINQAGIKTLDFSGWDIENLMNKNAYIDGDGHPSAAYNEFMAPYLARVLK